ncbi:MAG: type II toxin-antitoxin system HicA family toxin [Nanoarchaeota archaeon]
MPKISPLNSNALIKILQKSGFKIIRQKGSHIIMIDDRRTRIVIPIHPGKDIKPGLIQSNNQRSWLKQRRFLQAS